MKTGRTVSMILGTLIAPCLALSACGNSHGMSPDVAQAYTCGQFDSAPRSQSDAQHAAYNKQVEVELLKVHGFADSPANEARLKGAIEAQLSGNALYDGSDCNHRRSTKLDNMIDWKHSHLSKNE